MSKQLFFRGTLLLTGAGLLTRLMGFFYRIFLSRTIGAEGLGIYQLLMPMQTMVMAFSTVGIQTAISRLSASRFALEHQEEARDFFLLGTFLSCILSCSGALFCFFYADFIACELLKEPAAKDLIRLLAFSFPLSSLHTCINSFCFARKKAGLPAFIQLLEQLVRIGSTWLLYLIFLSEGRTAAPVIAAFGTLAGEMASALVSLFYMGSDFHTHHYRPCPFSQIGTRFGEIGKTALPLTVNRVLLTILGSIEVVLIPQMLRRYGLEPSDALSIYGIFTGMALPLILFPSTITNSASAMLMPSIAELQAKGFSKRIRYVVTRASSLCVVLGTGCCVFFLLFGKFLGLWLFHSETAGIFIRTLSFICPFLYLNTTLSGILNGLGKSGTCLIHNSAGLIIRIASVAVLVPQMGIRGYFYGILISECLLSLLHLKALYLA